MTFFCKALLRSGHWVNMMQTQLNHVLTQDVVLDGLVIGISKPTGQTVEFPFEFGMRSTVRMRAN